MKYLDHGVVQCPNAVALELVCTFVLRWCNSTSPASLYLYTEALHVYWASPLAFVDPGYTEQEPAQAA